MIMQVVEGLLNVLKTAWRLSLSGSRGVIPLIFGRQRRFNFLPLWITTLWFYLHLLAAFAWGNQVNSTLHISIHRSDVSITSQQTTSSGYACSQVTIHTYSRAQQCLHEYTVDAPNWGIINTVISSSITEFLEGRQIKSPSISLPSIDAS